MTDESQQISDNSPQVNATKLSVDTTPAFDQQGQRVNIQFNVAGNYIEATAPRRFNAPAPPAHFTGREDYLAKFTQLLTTGEPVASTALHGMGGIGKTSLALKLADRVQEQFPGGVLWWNLGPNPDVITALDVWARHADPRADLTTLPTAEARAEAARPLLARLGKLCVIIDDVWDSDSFNILRSAVPAGCPLLITTRDANLAKSLRCRVERIDALSDDEAITMLAKLLGPLEGHEDATCDIAHLTEGLPLALELIAGLADTPADLPVLAQRLRERSPLDVLKRGTTREQSIETCFTLSYDHLDPDLQRRFCALGVFSLAPFDRDAIAYVWNEDGDAERVDQAISQLVRRSLLSKVEGTAEYRQHALLHDYAVKLLKAEENPHPSPPPSETTSDRGGSGTPSPVRGSNAIDESATSDQQTGEVRDGDRIFAARHADYYRIFASTQDWRAIEHVFDQIEHGWQWVQANAPEQIIDYVGAIRVFFNMRGRPFEHIAWQNIALAQARIANDRTNEGALLNNIAYVYNDLGHMDKALDTYQQALAIHREVGNHSGQGTTLNNISGIYYARGQLQEALDTFQQALVIRREVGDHPGEGTTLNNIGLIHRARRQMQEALDTYQQALAICREVGDRSGEGTTLNNIGGIYTARGQLAEALDTYQQALDVAREVGNRSVEGTALNNIGAIYQARGQIREALDTFQQVLNITREVGNRSGEGFALAWLGEINRQGGHIQEALNTYQQVLSILREIGDRWHESITLRHIGVLLDILGRTAEAVSYLEQCVALDEALGHPDLERDRAVLERVLAKLAAS